MIKVELNKSNSNPFFGLKSCLNLLNTNVNVKTQDIDKAWEEVKNSKEKREMFFSLLFSIGDITNRQHNMMEVVMPLVRVSQPFCNGYGTTTGSNSRSSCTLISLMSSLVSILCLRTE